MEKRAAVDQFGHAHGMQRAGIRAYLDRYAAAWPEEAELVGRFRGFVEENPRCLSRACVPGHITASAWILDSLDSAALLTHHKKLRKWLQLGGHVEGEEDVALASLREAREESGMADFELVRWRGGPLRPLDLDVHTIPATTSEPAHLHWDVRFLLRAREGQQLVMSSESNRLQWVQLEELQRYTDEESVLRMHRKATGLFS